MGKPVSHDLQSRLVAAEAGGLSRRAAAARCGVSAASAIRWVRASRSIGTIAPKPQGGDTRSHRIEAFRDVILSAINARKNASLVELADLLRGRAHPERTTAVHTRRMRERLHRSRIRARLIGLRSKTDPC